MKKILLFLLYITNVFAADQQFNLVLAYKDVNYSGKTVKALAFNDQIPGPVLRFQEGDEVTINVTNKLEDGTAVHWHGLLLPWQMDGVENITQDPIPPGHTFQYKFKLKQSGTYWYHAHAGLQEQQGLYGAFIVDPIKKEPYSFDKDLVVVLSDWSDEDPEHIFANLKKKGGYYSGKFPIQPSLDQFISSYDKADENQKEQMLQDYRMMQEMRMNIFDFSDVAYDAFLFNGKTHHQPWTANVSVGDVIRLRFIGASGSTKYNIKIPGTKFNIIHVQGNDIESEEIEEFTISPGETIDILLQIKQNKPYTIIAESYDKLGFCTGTLFTAVDQKREDPSKNLFPEPKAITMHDHEGQAHQGHDMTMGTKYQTLKASYKTNDPDVPVEIIRMDLYGYMDRYVWFINGLMEHEAKPIIIKPGKRYRLIFKNTSMMTHPMHLHGHFMILRNGHGEYDPLLHTIEVAPGATVVADFDADASGQWFFHCHHIFHMMSGMARVFQYEDLQKNKSHSHLTDHPMGHPPHIYQALFFEISADPFKDAVVSSLKFNIGQDYHKLQLYSDESELHKGKIDSAAIDVFYWHLLSEFWAVKGGMNYVYGHGKKTYLQPGLGVEGILPYFIEVNLRSYYHNKRFKFDLELSRDFQLTRNIFIKTTIQTELSTRTKPFQAIEENKLELKLRPYYALSPNVSLFTQLTYEKIFGFSNKTNLEPNKQTKRTLLLFGLSIN